MSYYNDLAFQLRCRRVPEAQIVEALREVRDLCEQSGQEPREQFGAASAYAEQFPEGTVRTRATRLAIVVLTVGCAVMAYLLLQRLWSDASPRVGPVPLILVLLPVQFSAIVAAIVADHRLPGGFRATEPAARD